MNENENQNEFEHGPGQSAPPPSAPQPNNNVVFFNPNQRGNHQPPQAQAGYGNYYGEAGRGPKGAGRDAGSSQNAGPGPASQAPGPGLGQYDFEALLKQMPKPGLGWIGKPPREAVENLGEWFSLGSGIVGGIVGKPLKAVWNLMDETRPPEQGQESGEYMSFLKRMLYRFGGAIVWAWSAFITQAVAARLFPFVNEAGVGLSKGGFFKDNLFSFSGRAIAASLVLTLMLSVVETMLYDPNKGKIKKILILGAFGLDIVINAVGWADFFGYSQKYEWIFLAPLTRGQNPDWASLVCQIAAVLNAALPEIMWDKARRARKMTRTKVSSSQGQRNRQQPGQGQGQEGQSGVWVKDAQGQMKWLSEAEVRRLAQAQKNQRKAAGGER